MKFLTGPKIWERITHLASTTGQAWVAVPYFGKGAAKMLPLSPGSILVTRFKRAAVRAGQVCPDDERILGVMQKFVVRMVWEGFRSDGPRV